MPDPTIKSKTGNAEEIKQGHTKVGDGSFGTNPQATKTYGKGTTDLKR